MENLAVRLADFLESVTTRVRELSVDRVDKAVKVVSLGIVALVLGIMALVLVFVAVYNTLAQWLTPAAALGVMGGIFLIAGLLVWAQRRRGLPPPQVAIRTGPGLPETAPGLRGARSEPNLPGPGGAGVVGGGETPAG